MTIKNDSSVSQYAQSGVDTHSAGESLSGLLKHIAPTWKFNPDYPVLGGKGFYASVIDIGNGDGIAFCTDGVGTKVVVAEMMDKYDTIGIDCVAMNVNDAICVGARPISLVDYIACQKTDDRIFEEIGKGLAEGAKQSSISISGGEISQVGEIVKGIDLNASCIGHVKIDKINTGSRIKPGNVIIGLESSGIHSNGLTLARKVLLGETIEEQKANLHKHEKAFCNSLGMELLNPTRIYVAEIMELIDSVDVKGMAHITGGGFTNLNRLAVDNVRFSIEADINVPAVFRVIQERGRISNAEMYEVFNMGIGFCVVVDNAEADKTIRILEKHGTPSSVIGRVTYGDCKEVVLPKLGLVGRGTSFLDV
jgi:phosphoribosylformylglycinamidine cyclo-ligase